MKTQELRIGNILKGETREGSVLVANVHEILECEVSLIFEGRVHRFTHDRIEPIPLTPEILTACGFENGELKGYNTGYGDIGISADDGAVHLMFESQISSQSILYLHQLQNLIYCLTGEELNYNL
jgi:hypothetical protein